MRNHVISLCKTVLLPVNLRHQQNLVISRINSRTYITIQKIRQNMADSFGRKLQEKPNLSLSKFLPQSQADIPVRKMKESFDGAILPLSSDLQLRERYTSNIGEIRLGRLMEDMDAFAGHISYKHLYYPNLPEDISTPVALVTIAVSQIDFLEQIKSNIDIRFTGHVCWVGQSSMEVVVWLHQEINGTWFKITRAIFLMAARNHANTGPALVNGVEPETPEEKNLFMGGNERKLERQKKMKESLLLTAPTQEELSTIHSLFISTINNDPFLNTRILPPNGKWMKDSQFKTLVFCHPEYRNLHNKIFGGFLMRQALELSWLVAYVHGLKIPRLIRMSDIGFYKPVEIGSVLKMSGAITYTEGNYVQVFVTATAFMKPTSGVNTTAFNFTYDLGEITQQVYPSTYAEAIKFVDGRRHFKNILNLEKSN